MSKVRRRAHWEWARIRKKFSPRPLRQDLVTSSTDRHIVVAGERFKHDRASLVRLVERTAGREKMVEVGSLAGFSTKLFCRYFEHVDSIDPYEAGYDDRHDRNSVPFRLHLARDLFTLRFLDEPNVSQYRERSDVACERFGDASLDFVYIDASHRYDDVLRDIHCWRPKIKPGGSLAGDDYSMEGVQKAVNETFNDFEVIEGRWITRID